MDYAKNFKAKNIVVRSIAFILYFFASGFMGKLCVLLIEPLFSVFLGQFPEIKNIILYIIGVIIMFTAVSFFSRREGYTDTELLRFSYLRTILSYAISGFVFYFIALFSLVLKISALTEYFFAPHFLPREITDIISNYVFFSGIPILYEIAEFIKYCFMAKWINLLFSVLFCVGLSIIFYKSGRTNWIAIKKKKIAQSKRAKKFTRN